MTPTLRKKKSLFFFLLTFVIIFLGLLIAYECLKRLSMLSLQRKLRLNMFVLFLSSIYAHYYGWWGLIQYLNEQYWYQWYHQIFFSVTELLSTVIVVHLCDKDVKIQPWQLLIICSLNFMHIIIGGLDQFVENVINGNGQVFEMVRDFGLMIPDLFHVLFCYFEARILADSKNLSIWKLFYKEELMAAAVFISLFTILGKNM